MWKRRKKSPNCNLQKLTEHSLKRRQIKIPKMMSTLTHASCPNSQTQKIRKVSQLTHASCPNSWTQKIITPRKVLPKFTNRTSLFIFFLNSSPASSFSSFLPHSQLTHAPSSWFKVVSSSEGSRRWVGLAQDGVGRATLRVDLHKTLG